MPAALIPAIIGWASSLLTRLLTGPILDQVFLSIAKEVASRTTTKVDDDVVKKIEETLNK